MWRFEVFVVSQELMFQKNDETMRELEKEAKGGGSWATLFISISDYQSNQELPVEVKHSTTIVTWDRYL